MNIIKIQNSKLWIISKNSSKGLRCVAKGTLSEEEESVLWIDIICMISFWWNNVEHYANYNINVYI